MKLAVSPDRIRRVVALVFLVVAVATDTSWYWRALVDLLLALCRLGATPRPRRRRRPGSRS